MESCFGLFNSRANFYSFPKASLSPSCLDARIKLGVRCSVCLVWGGWVRGLPRLYPPGMRSVAAQSSAWGGENAGQRGSGRLLVIFLSYPFPKFPSVFDLHADQRTHHGSKPFESIETRFTAYFRTRAGECWACCRGECFPSLAERSADVLGLGFAEFNSSRPRGPPVELCCLPAK